MYVHANSSFWCGWWTTHSVLTTANNIICFIKVSQQEIQEYIDGYKTKLEPLYSPVPTVSDSELTSLGAKDRETEVEKFIQANTQVTYFRILKIK